MIAALRKVRVEWYPCKEDLEFRIIKLLVFHKEELE